MAEISLRNRRNRNFISRTSRPKKINLRNLPFKMRNTISSLWKFVIAFDALCFISTIDTLCLVKTIDALCLVKTIDALCLVKTTDALCLVKTTDALCLVKTM